MTEILEIDGVKWNKYTAEGGEVMISRNTDHIKYKQIGKLWFHEETAAKVCAAIRKAYDNEWLVKIYQGDVETGRVWHEEWDRVGHIGRSTGSRQIPLLVVPRELGGDGYGGRSLMDHCIVGLKTVDTGEWLYMHPTMKLPDVTVVPSIEKGYKYSTLCNGELYGNHKTLEDAYKTREMIST